MKPSQKRDDEGERRLLLPQMVRRRGPKVHTTMHLQNKKQRGQSLRTANSRRMFTFMWRFIIADTTQSIIRAEFLAHYHLLPDI